MITMQQVLNYTQVYRSGHPFKTEAVVLPIVEKNFVSNPGVTYFDIHQDGEKTRLRYHLAKSDRVYGLGQQMGGLNKRGRRYRTFATDRATHTPNLDTLYGAHPFLIVQGNDHFGIFIDYPSEIIFDIGFSHKDVLDITIPSEHFDLYIFDVADTRDIIREYLTLTGAPYIPPKWAFGYQQSRYGYRDADTVRTIAENFRKHEIPCDAIYLDIDYLDTYKVFTIDEEQFPDFDQMIKQLQDDGFQPVPIIDAAVKIEAGYDVCEEGKANGYFCVDEKGDEFVCGVWPGPTYLPDFLRPDVRAWWAQKYVMFTELGIHGFWNDMNEPAIFYTPEHLKYVAQRVNEIFEKEKLGMEFLVATEDLYSIFNRREYFRQFYHTAPDGKQVNHEDVHNLYGFNMVRAAAEGFQDLLPNKRYLLISRSSYAGMQRYAGIWTGDNDSWWEHLLLNIKMLMSLNMIGLLYTGADIGGFGSETSPELMIRWMQFGIFSPLCRNHTWFGARDQEPWSFDDECTAILREAIRLRYALLPYTYTEYMRAARHLEPLIIPLFLEFKTEQAHEIEDQFLYGKSVMAAPVYTANARGRFVYLPECRWLYWKASRYEDRQMEVMEPGNHYVQAGLQDIPIFLRENHLVVLAEPTNYVGEKPVEELTVIGLVTDEAIYTYYDDDGETLDYKQDKYATLTIRVRKAGERYEITCQKDEDNGFRLPVSTVNCELYNERGDIYRASLAV